MSLSYILIFSTNQVLINLTHFSLIFNFYTPALVWRRVRSYVHMLAHVLINLDERKIPYANRFYLPDTTQTKQHFLELNIFWGVRFFNWLSFLYFSLPVLAFFFFKFWIHSMQGWTAATRHGVTRQRSTKKVTA